MLQLANIGSMDDIQSLFKATIAEFMENGRWMRNWAIVNMTIRTRTKITAATVTAARHCTPADVLVPHDQKGEFEPQVLKKSQTSINQDIEGTILSMYVKSMAAGDIDAHIQDIYGISGSYSTISRITDKILPIAREWQRRPLETIYAVVFLDAIHYHVRSEGQIVKKAVCIAIGIDLDGRRDVLDIWVGENERVKFGATVLNGLKNRDVENIFISCTVNLTGFDAAIHLLSLRPRSRTVSSTSYAIPAGVLQGS